MNHLLILSNINRKYNPTSNCFRIGDFNYINNLLDQFFEHKFDINEFLNICTLLFNTQIFTDGNSRTIFDYMKIILSENGYRIDIDKIKKDYAHARVYFPIMYDLNEKINEESIIKMKEYIIKDSNKKLILKK